MRGVRRMDECRTIALPKTALRCSTAAFVYDVPKQDAGIHLSPMPAIRNTAS
jgi:hypothetical protein